MEKIFLKQNISKKGAGVDNFIHMGLSTDSRLLPVSEVNNKINAYEEYVSEKDSSDKYRLTFTINPICTNVLFNAYTEIVYNEGSDDCAVITNTGIVGSPSKLKDYQKYTQRTSINKKTCIQDTGYSHSSVGPFVYHCGLDIFNNHFLRKKEFSFINKYSVMYSYTGNFNFNTLSDYLRDSKGETIKEKLLKIKGSSASLSNEYTEMHVYRVDSVETYKRTVQEKLKEENGWLGFSNPTTLNIENYIYGGTYNEVINKCMNNNKADEFIDMYPDRSLYSFIPKYNKFRNRMENNWDYCITYPYSSITNNVLVSNGIRGFVIDECNLSDSILDNGTGSKKEENRIIYLRTQIRNSFTIGSFINITISTGSKTAISDAPIKIVSLGYAGDDTNHIFGINLIDFYAIISLTSDDFLDAKYHLLERFEIRIRKYESGADCLYYIRKFRKLPNFKDSDAYADGGVTEEEVKANLKPFNSSLNKLAYGENIFSDKVAQIVFNDDIVTTGIKDNLGRELSEIYLTIVKNNKGYKEWYENKNYTSSAVTFSHCFGRIDSGFDLSKEESNYNIHKISTDLTVARMSSDITIDNDVFDGDIVEFSPMAVQEKVLEPIYFRFNTAQREYTNSEFGNGIYYDELVSDDYDIDNGFKIDEKKLNNIGSIHLNPEGYYYKPHYRVCVKEFDRNINQGNHIKMAFSGDIVKVEGNTFHATTAVNYFLNIGDKIYFYKKYTHEKKTGVISSVGGKTFSDITFQVNGISAAEIKNDYFVYKINSEMPDGAYELNDGTGRYLWREKKSDKDMSPNDELYNSVFTNGAHYAHQNINFFLRRQDPTGEFGLSEKSPMDNFVGFEGKIKEVSQAEYIEEGEGTVC